MSRSILIGLILLAIVAVAGLAIVATSNFLHAALTDEEIQELAGAESLLADSGPRLRCHVDNVVVGGIRARTVTSMDIVNGDEVITDLGNDRFIYRPIGANTWQVAPPLTPNPIERQHSIAWSDSVSPPRYFVADTRTEVGDGRIVSFESLRSSTTHSETDTIGSVDLTRPHDLEFNPDDGYFYGVTAPLKHHPSSTPKVLFRFRDIGLDEGTLDLGGTTDNSRFYMRSLSIVEGVVHAVNSRGPSDRGPQVIRIDDFEQGHTTVYTAPASFAADLQAIEFHDGWWYGTGNHAGPLLARWRDWADFETGSWEDLSDLLQPNESSISVAASTAYFLTRWNGRLFFTVFHSSFNRQDRVYELLEANP